MRTPEPKKQLGQHWLKDKEVLSSILDFAQISDESFVLEIGPGPGDMTKKLSKRVKKVVAIEIDEALADALPKYENVEVIKKDIRQYDLGSLPPDYIVVANLPYYLTSHILQQLAYSDNPPSSMTLLIQKEVAERIAAVAGQHSILSISLQLFGKPKLGPIVGAELFEPPPKVDSQVIRIERHDAPIVKSDVEQIIRLAKIGFSSKRKKLTNNLRAGLTLEKTEADELLKQANIETSVRAQELSLQQWDNLCTVIE